MLLPQSFSRDERLKSDKVIETLFKSGQSFVAHPFRVVWLPTSEAVFPVKLAISVPRKHFKKAVDRNRLKRRIREAFRRNKADFYEKLRASGMKVTIILMLIAKEEVNYEELERGIHKLIRKFPYVEPG
jgi:ribonuclease P protein component